jgi:hypothetical protein
LVFGEGDVVAACGGVTDALHSFPEKVLSAKNTIFISMEIDKK